MTDSLLILNAQIVNEKTIFSGDVLIRKGRIEAIDADLQAQPVDQVLDAQGLFLLPGMIDSQIFCYQAGADLLTEGSAALAGGITSVLELPNIDLEEQPLTIEERKNQLMHQSSVNYGFYQGATSSNLELLKTLAPEETCGISVFTGGGHTQYFVDDPEVLEQIFTHAPVLVVAHCEDTPTILENEESYRSIYGDQIPMGFHPVIRSEEACFLSSAFAIELAKRCESRLHLMRISTAREIESLPSIQTADDSLSAEISLPYLHFSDEDYAALGSLIKIHPAIKSDEDRAGLIQGVLDGRIGSISSGHVVVSLAEKQKQGYFNIPPGIPMLQYALPVLLEHYHDGIFSLELIAEKTSHAVAERFNIQERGYIREGYWADLVLIDTEQPVTGCSNQVLSASGWTPFDGYEFRSAIRATIVNGHLAYQSQQLLGKPSGLPLSFTAG